MTSSNSQIDKPQRGCSKRAELPGVNINTQSINTERAFFKRAGKPGLSLIILVVFNCRPFLAISVNTPETRQGC